MSKSSSTQRLIVLGLESQRLMTLGFEIVGFITLNFLKLRLLAVSLVN